MNLKENKKEKKEWFDVEFEITVPVTVRVRVEAEDFERAIFLANKKVEEKKFLAIQYFFNKKINKLIKIYTAGTSFLKFKKTL